eukprot:m.128046 g.128046  ORF g.128046 m.128046 type:complete len:559 (-) comp9449_c1_seq1:256-1932(-)
MIPFMSLTLLSAVAFLIVVAVGVPSSNAQINVDITSCMLQLQSSSSSFQLTINPTDLSNKFELSIPQLFNGAYDATVTCRDASSAPLFSNTFSFTVDATSQDIILSNLEEASLNPTASPSIDYMAFHISGSNMIDFKVLATSPSSSPVSYNITSFDSANSATTMLCSSSTSACTGTIPSGSVSGVVLVDSVPLLSLDATASVSTQIFNQFPSIPALSISSDAVAFGDTATISATFVDNDVSDSNSTSETFDVALSMDHVDGSGAVLTPGGGSACDESWINGGSLTHRFTSVGYKGRSLSSVSFAPTGGVSSRYCRINVEVTDWEGKVRTSSVTVNVGVASTSSTPASVSSPVSNVLPMVFSRLGTMATLTLYSPDKCDVVDCENATQCTLASVCNSADGMCLDPVPTPGAVCDDNDITTTNETCSVQGVCIGVQKCNNVVCKALSTCHNPGVCDITTGICSASLLKQANEYCDDDNENTVFDTCDNVGGCSGLDVSEVTVTDVMGFNSIAGINPTRMKAILSAIPNVCCNGQLCCEPCSSGTCDSNTSYDNLYYLQTA